HPLSTTLTMNTLSFPSDTESFTGKTLK
ncbi:unnamed protein product, partial [Rotaria sordida]